MIFLLFLLQTPVSAKNMYRWVDEEGNVRFSDKVPPEEVKHRRETLNKNARTVGVVEKEKTKAQRELDKRLSVLRKQQQDIIDKQRMHDKVLLSTFRNVDDMKMALKGQMLAMDGKRKIVHNNLQRLQKQLREQQRKAAQFERDGKRVPSDLSKSIRTSKQQIKQAYVDISAQFQNKKKIRQEFEEDIERFIFLTKSSEESQDLSRELAETRAASELGLFICENMDQCKQAWKVAKQFVYLNSTVSLDIETDKLIMGKTPSRNTDLSLSVSKITESGYKEQLFLDIRCRNSSLGQELCSSSKVKKIRNSFSDFIKAGIKKL